MPLNLRDSYARVTWDLATKNFNLRPWGKIGDTGRGIIVTVAQNGVVITPTTETLRMSFIKPDGTEGYIEATLEGGKYYIENMSQVFAVAGIVNADLEFQSGTEFVRSDTFTISVHKPMQASTIVSSNDYSALQETLNKAAGLESQFQEVLANATVDSEVINARGGKVNLKVRLDASDAQLADIDQRVDAIIITPVEGVSAQEIVDARGGYGTLNQRIQAVDDASVKTVNGTTPDNDGNIVVSVSGAKPTHDITVGKQGCDYTTIAAALAYGKTLAPTKVNLHVHNGVYEEVIDLRYNTNVCIIGENKKECILINKSGLYANSPLMVSGENYIKNMTFIANHESNPSFSAPYAYAMHYDYTGPGETIFENCRFESYQNAAVGIGMHQDQTLKFIDCDMYSDSSVYDGGSLYFHNAVASGVTNQHLVIERGSIYSKTGYAVKADDANIGSGDGLGNEMDVTFIDVSIHSDVYGETIDKNTAPIGVDALVGNVKLHPRTSWNKGLKSNNTGSNGQVLTSNGDGTCEFKNSGAALGVSNFSATVGTTWAGTVPPYSQAISVPGISASDNPFVDVVLSGDYSTDVSILAAWDNIYRITTGEGSITVFSSAANTASIPIQLKVVK